MSATAWIVLIVLFVGLHLLMHRGHGMHGTARPARPRGGGHPNHARATKDSQSTSEPGLQQRHRGC